MPYLSPIHLSLLSLAFSLFHSFRASRVFMTNWAVLIDKKLSCVPVSDGRCSMLDPNNSSACLRYNTSSFFSNRLLRREWGCRVHPGLNRPALLSSATRPVIIWFLHIHSHLSYLLTEQERGTTTISKIIDCISLNEQTRESFQTSYSASPILLYPTRNWLLKRHDPLCENLKIDTNMTFAPRIVQYPRKDCREDLFWLWMISLFLSMDQ